MPDVSLCPCGHELLHPSEEGTTKSIDPRVCPQCGLSVATQAEAALPPTPPSTRLGASEEQAPVVPPTVAPLTPSTELARKVGTVEVPGVLGYEILGELGRGGMGVVYKAQQTKLRRLVALKMILAGGHASQRTLARFQAEARAVARLQHPNIVQIYEVGDTAGLPYFSLEFVDGGTLAEKLYREEMATATAAQLIEALARAMHFAHEHGIVHRDLKPGNILLTRDGVPKITDFGLAKELDGTSGATETGIVMGTPGYMAPEQASGKSKSAGPAADIYALGAILYECLTGRPPFVGETPLDVIFLVTTEEPVPPSRLRDRVPRDLETICLKCLEKPPQRRYASAEALAEDLRRFREHETIEARPLHRGQRLVRWVRRHPVQATVLAAVVLLAAVVAGSLGYQRRVEKARREQARNDVRDLLLRGQEAIHNRAWDSAREVLQPAIDRTSNEPGLEDLGDEAAERLRQAEGRLAAIDRHRRFQRLHDDALFHATLSSGAAGASNLEASRRAAHRALQLADEQASRDPPGEFLTETQREEFLQGRYELLLVLADAAAQEGRGHLREAIALLRQAADLGIATQSYHLRMARFLAQLGDTAEAELQRRQAAAAPPKTAFDHYLVGVERYHEGPEAALPSFLEALRLKPGDFWARYFLALCHVRLRKLELARDNLTPCLARQRKVVWVYLLRGFTQGQLGDSVAAEEDFAQALAILEQEPNPEAAYALYNNRAVLRIGTKKYTEAIADLKKAIELCPEQYQAHATLAQAYLQQGNPDAAAAAYGQAIASAQRLMEAGHLEAPTLAVLYRNRARLSIRRGDLRAAEGDLRRSVDLETVDGPSRGLAWADYAAVLAQQKQLPEAIAAYDASLKARPGHATTLRRRAEILFQLERYAEAEEGLTQFLKNNGPPTPRVYRMRATARSKQGNHRGALDDLTAALARESDDPELWVQRGQTYLACKAWELAAQDFDRAMQLNDHLGNAYAGRGYARVQLGQHVEGTADAEHAVRAGPVTPRLLQTAAGTFVRAILRTEDDRGLQFFYRSRAIALLRQALEQTPAPERAAFWKNNVQRDGALRPLRATDEYQEWDRLYGK
jgi:tetratricopeptide (TPR) repeat protein/tRNA A-37 threonylcarbamoyl transferase component Bud32